MKDFLEDKPKVINIGLEAFKDSLQAQATPCVHVDWRPPAAVDPESRAIVRKHEAAIEKGNKEAMKRILNGTPHLAGLDIALQVIPGMKKNLILHSGPPIEWNRMCGPMRGAVVGALLYENMALGIEEAEELAASGAIEFSPCHEHLTVGPMAGIVSSSMPVFVVENEEYGNRAYCTMNEGLGKVLRYGAYDEEVIQKLRWMEEVLYPLLRKAIELIGRIDLKTIIAQALHMGDEVHNRNRAGTSLLYRALAPAIVRTEKDQESTAQVLDFINGNDHFFLNLSMPACKAVLDAARNIEKSSIVVVMSRNGTEFGVQLSGTGDEWFTGPAAVPDALFFPGYSKEDANPDIGDSSITETAGLGGFAIAASPAIVQFVGGEARDALNYTLQMYEISAGENGAFQIPALNFRGTPTGIDVIKIMERNILPFIDTGVAHKSPGVGQVGAGVLNAPLEPFEKAYRGFCKTFKK